MCAEVIDGKALAAEIYTELAQEVTSLKQAGRQPKLVVLLVGSHEASLSYVRAKKRIGATIGIEVLLEQFAEDVTEQVLLTRIKELNEAQSVDGILVQLPLPVHISVNKVICAILPTKDVDGFHPLNVGRWMTGQEAFLPCTPLGIMELCHRSGLSLAGKHVVVIGRSNLVGKPVAMLMQEQNATVTMCHSYTQDLAKITSAADLLVVAAGQAKLITLEHVRPGMTVIDVGINRTAAGLVGDVDFQEVQPVVTYITPVPGGVGPMTIAMLMKNCVRAAKTKVLI